MSIQPEVVEELEKATTSRFWGDIRLSSQAGTVILIPTESNRKLTTNRPDNKEISHGQSQSTRQ